MDDQDLILRNQAAILSALGFLLLQSAGNNERKRAAVRPQVEILYDYALETKAHVVAKLNRTTFISQAELEEIARATSGNPWPDDLVEKACRRAGKEEEPL